MQFVCYFRFISYVVSSFQLNVEQRDVMYAGHSSDFILKIRESLCLFLRSAIVSYPVSERRASINKHQLSCPSYNSCRLCVFLSSFASYWLQLSQTTSVLRSLMNATDYLLFQRISVSLYKENKNIFG